MHFRAKNKKIRSLTRFASCVAACFVLTACQIVDSKVLQDGAAQKESASCPAGLTMQIQDRLYMGAGTSKGWVSPEEFETFLDQVVTPRFPSGFTVLRSAGQWRHADGTISKEPSWLLSVMHEPAQDGAVDEIAAKYKSGFHQEAVLRIRSVVCASFIGSETVATHTGLPKPKA